MQQMFGKKAGGKIKPEHKEHLDKMWRGQVKLIFYLTGNLFKKDDSS